MMWMRNGPVIDYLTIYEWLTTLEIVSSNQSVIDYRRLYPKGGDGMKKGTKKGGKGGCH